MKSKNNIHDKSYKALFSNKEIFLNLIQDFVSDTWCKELTKDNLVLVNKSYVLSDYNEMESDIVYKAKIGESDVFFYLLLEFQSSVDYRMPVRLLLYMIEIWREILKNTGDKNFRRKAFRLPAVVPIVLYNGTKTWTAARSLKDVISSSEVFGENILDFKYIFLDVNKYEKDELYRKDSISSAIFLLDQNINALEFYDRLRDIVIGFNKLTAQEKLQLKQWLVNVNLDDNNLRNNIENMFNAGKEEVLSMTSNISKGLEKLKEEGVKEGRAEGKAEGKAEALIKLLTKKLHEIPETYKDKINKLPEVEIDIMLIDIFDIEKVEDLDKYFTRK